MLFEEEAGGGASAHRALSRICRGVGGCCSFVSVCAYVCEVEGRKAYALSLSLALALSRSLALFLQTKLGSLCVYLLLEGEEVGAEEEGEGGAGLEEGLLQLWIG